jgi:hypothetical protein
MTRAASIAAVILGLLIAVGVIWGAGTALLVAYPIFMSCVVTVWAVLAGRLDQRAAGWYYERQLTGRGVNSRRAARSPGPGPRGPSR